MMFASCCLRLWQRLTSRGSRNNHRRLLCSSGKGEDAWSQIKASMSGWRSLIPKWSSMNWKKPGISGATGVSENQTGWDTGRVRANKQTQTERREQLIYRREGQNHWATGGTQTGNPTGEQTRSVRSGLNHRKKTQLNRCTVTLPD